MKDKRVTGGSVGTDNRSLANTVDVFDGKKMICKSLLGVKKKIH